jgi:hypothetical protein
MAVYHLNDDSGQTMGAFVCKFLTLPCEVAKNLHFTDKPDYWCNGLYASIIRYNLGSTRESTLPMRKNVWRAVIEVGFIIFLFYSNLLMGEFERSGMGQKRGLASAMEDVFTAANFEIAIIAALIGYGLFEFLRKKF